MEYYPKNSDKNHYIFCQQKNNKTIDRKDDMYVNKM